jgi:hypothetical protein
MIDDEIKAIKKMIKELKIDIKDVKSIEVKWEAVLYDKAFPRINIKFK